MKIIAEVGSNWKTLQDCLFSIEQARMTGAHAVKFQLFSNQMLYGVEDMSVTGVTPYLDPLWIPVLHNHAKKNEIEFMCTAFSPYGYEYINEFVQCHKIASAEMSDINILDTVNKLGKPVYLSTGGARVYDEVRLALLHLKSVPVTIMYCVADYPARIIDFRHLEELQLAFGPNYSYGYSDHSIDVLNIPQMAKDHGCSLIEKHVNFTEHTDTNDAPHSLNFDEFSMMARTLMGERVPKIETFMLSNKSMRSTHKRRFIVTKPIAKGETFKLNVNVGIYRAKSPSEDAVHPFRPFDFDGKTAARDKQFGEVVCYSDL